MLVKHMIFQVDAARDNAREAAKALTKALRYLHLEQESRQLFNELDDALMYLREARVYAKSVFDAIA